MAITRIKAKNFKSFKELDVELGDLNILIGANASGKSNFVDIFRFLRDIEDSGLGNAISAYGTKYLRNINIGSSEVFSLEVVSNQTIELMKRVEKRSIKTEVYETIYEFIIQFEETGPEFEIVEDKLTLKCNFIQREAEEGKAREIGRGDIVLSKTNGKVNKNLVNTPKGVSIDDIFPTFWEEDRPRPGTLLLEDKFVPPLIWLTPFLAKKTFCGTSIYDFDPKFGRRYAPISGKAELEENGSNLAIAIKSIIESEDGKRKLMNLVTYLLDFVDDLNVERAADKSFLFKLRETYSEELLPASLISDGTVNMVALIIALYFGGELLTIIEEPERSIHPYLISKVVNMMEDASENKQIIVTTHNPEMVRYANEKDLLLISRDHEGFSSISKPSDKEDLKIFLENGLRMEDLYVDSLLETL